MKRRLQDNDLPLVNAGFVLLIASIFLTMRGDEFGVALFMAGGLVLGIGLWLHITRFI